MNNKIRVRFAPSPTGFMHLGNVRIALINYIFSKQKKGTFVLRIEDTDPQRTLAGGSIKIFEDLNWLKIFYDEGPIKGGPFEPYFQSKRSHIYQLYLEKFKEKNLIYPCFCTSEELEKKRKKQLSLKMPPRYDRTCLKLNPEDVNHFILTKPFIWRFKLDYEKTVSFYDMAHKTMTFDLKHFSDIPLTRQDGSFTFMFANFVDDHEMQISYVFRGEDHLSNTALQVALYEALDLKIPIFWHLPILGNKEGKKLSKRDFGFALNDLKNAGFLPEAIVNYLAILGETFEKEIMDINQIIKTMDFEHISPTGIIKYDYEKLLWINHQWIMNYDTNQLAELCRPFLESQYEEVSKLNNKQLVSILKPIQPELTTLAQSIKILEFYFKRPILTKELLENFGIVMYEPFIHHLLAKIKNTMESPEEVTSIIKTDAKEHKIEIKDIFKILRIALTGKPEGPAFVDLINILGPKESFERLSRLCNKHSH